MKKKNKYLQDWNESDEINFLYFMHFENLHKKCKNLRDELRSNLGFTIADAEAVFNKIISFYKQTPELKLIKSDLFIDTLDLIDTLLSPIEYYPFWEYEKYASDFFSNDEKELFKKIVDYNLIKYMGYIKDYSYMPVEEIRKKYNQKSTKAIESKIKRIMEKLIDVGIFELLNITDTNYNFYDIKKKGYKYIEICKYISSIYYKFSGIRFTQNSARRYKKSGKK